MYVPTARAHHVGSGSLDGALRFFDKPVFFQRQALRNRYLTLMKNASLLDSLQLVPAMLIGELLLWPLLFLRQPWRFPALLKTPVELLVRLPGVWRWRREIQRRRSPEAGAVHRWLRGW
jgi:hypothetical protein